MKMSKKILAGALIFSACSVLSTVAQADNTITFNGVVSERPVRRPLTAA